MFVCFLFVRYFSNQSQRLHKLKVHWCTTIIMIEVRLFLSFGSLGWWCFTLKLCCLVFGWSENKVKEISLQWSIDWKYWKEIQNQTYFRNSKNVMTNIRQAWDLRQYYSRPYALLVPPHTSWRLFTHLVIYFDEVKARLFNRDRVDFWILFIATCEA